MGCVLLLLQLDYIYIRNIAYYIIKYYNNR